MKEWFTLAELAAAALPGLPKNEIALNNLARKKWRGNPERARLVPGKTKPVWQYHVFILPNDAKSRLMVLNGVVEAIAHDAMRAEKKALWARYEGLLNKHKDACKERLNCLDYAADLRKGGLTLEAANIAAAARFNVAPRTLYIWQNMVAGYDRFDWLAALAPSFQSTAVRSECHEAAWDVLLSDYLRPSGPSFSACYRRMVVTAIKNDWSPIPQERVLRRRLNAEVPQQVQTLARKGKEKMASFFPTQRRDRSMLHAMEAVNMDGHKLDVFINVPWSEKPVRLYLIGIQDLYSGKLLSWRLSDAENWEIVRLVIGDMIEGFGIPDKITLDNGRAFASKWISGGASNRYRFKVKDDDPQGLLTTFGIQTQWTTPYSGQSKPIERTWRDLAEVISKHPFCAGAYTGNKPDAKPEDYGTRAIAYEDFKAHVAEQITLHNAMQGRKGGNCKGRSFDQTFAESIDQPSTVVRYATETQKALWLLASDIIRARKGSGEIHFHGNRYWDRALNAYAGQKITIRFDPDNLHQPIRVYDLNNSLICVANCLADTGFYDQNAARQHAHAKRDFEKGVRMQKEATVKLKPNELADIYGSGKTKQALKETPAPRAKITRLVTGNLAVKEHYETMNEEEFENSFSVAMNRVIPFPKAE